MPNGPNFFRSPNRTGNKAKALNCLITSFGNLAPALIRVTSLTESDSKKVKHIIFKMQNT